jgi:glycosyltransferase involved in cell wall biosynthesis
MSDRPLRILHVLRSPVGGLFRHVRDLVRGQAARGHAVGIVCDATTGGEYAAAALREIAPHLTLGLSRVPMLRQLGLKDYVATRHVRERIAATQPDVVHGHGAKGAAYARLAAPVSGPLRVYTPHGGSLLYRPGTPVSAFYLLLERLLVARTDLFLFESAFIARLFRTKVCDPPKPAVVVPNGVGPDEFQAVPLRADATDILYIGELRALKGVDILLDALAALRESGLPLTATLVGAGRARADLKQQAQRLGLGETVRFVPPTPARAAFALGRVMVVPSRAESFPYIVLEAAAAAKPLVVTRVGGIADIYGPEAERLIPPDDVAALARALREAINHPDRSAEAARLLQERVRHTFGLDRMIDEGIAAYRAAIGARKS